MCECTNCDCGQCAVEPPKYVSKTSPEIKVFASKIFDIIYDDALAEQYIRDTDYSATLYFQYNQQSAYIEIDSDFINKFNPEIGNYYVVDSNNTASIMDAKTFESQYKEVN